jgi:hypothetical protein
MVKSITDLIGDQTPLPSVKDIAVYFMVPVVGMSGNTESFQMQRVVCERVRNYYSIEEILDDYSILPENSKKYTVEVLKRHIASDSRRGMGTHLPEHNIVAYSGAGAYDKPIASINVGGTVRYILNPNFSNMVKRV